VGGWNGRTNIDVVRTVSHWLDERQLQRITSGAYCQ